MSLIKDITGQRFGRLYVLNMSRNRDGKNTEWRCRCDCGKETWVQRAGLTSGNTRSCGCLNGGLTSSKSKTIGVLTRTKYCRIVEIAKKRKLEFMVSQKYLADLADTQTYRCALTNVPLTFPVSSKGSVGSSSNASLDRIDSTKGYIEGNVQWLLKDVNMMKQQLTEKRFIELCKLIAKEN